MLQPTTTRLLVAGLSGLLSMVLVACSPASTDDNINYMPADPWAQSNPAATALNSDEPETETDEVSRNLVATYEGVLPAASAEGIQYTISFHDDNTFHLHRVYLGRPESLDNSYEDKGAYESVTGLQDDPEALRYVIHPKDEFNRTGFLVEDENTLRMLDRQQRIIDTEPNYALTRTYPEASGS